MPRQNKIKKVILGITGGYSSGKSTVAAMFEEYGAGIIDADKLAHNCIAPKGKCYGKIIRAFGARILRRDKTIDRKKLGEIVFANRKMLKVINNIIHPEAIREIKRRIVISKSRVIVLDVPLLIESGLRGLVDKLIVVSLSRNEQIKRALSKSGLKRSDALKRINSQIPMSAKMRLADFVIDNGGTRAKTKKQVAEIRRKLWKN